MKNKLWIAVDNFEYQASTFIVEGKTQTEAFKNAKNKLKSLGAELEEGENIEVYPLLLPNGYEIVKTGK